MRPKCFLLLAAVACSGSSSSRPSESCAVSGPVAYRTARRYPLQQAAPDSADFQLVIEGAQLVPGTAHICVTSAGTLVYRDSVRTGMWVRDGQSDSAAVAYAASFFANLDAFPEHPIPWGHGERDPYGQWESDDPYAALARGLALGNSGKVDTSEVIAAVQEFARVRSVRLSYWVDPEATKTVVWWPSRRQFVELVL
jgi:hypothetical protein